MTLETLSKCYQQAPSQMKPPAVIHNPKLFRAGRYTPAAKLVEYRDYAALPHEYGHHIFLYEKLSRECEEETVADFAARIIYLERQLLNERNRGRISAAR